jgi:hypothetical protein
MTLVLIDERALPNTATDRPSASDVSCSLRAATYLSFRTTLNCAAIVRIVHARACMRACEQSGLCVHCMLCRTIYKKMLSAVDDTAASCTATGLRLHATMPNAAQASGQVSCALTMAHSQQPLRSMLAVFDTLKLARLCINTIETQPLLTQGFRSIVDCRVHNRYCLIVLQCSRSTQ